ncbi:MAG: OmpA family protein [Polaromonas sp.]
MKSTAKLLKSIRTPVALALAGLLLTACAPASYVVLLNNDDGSVGKIQVSNSQGITVLDKAREGTLMNDAAGKTFVATPQQIEKDFGVALAARPPKPATFLLYFQPSGAALTPESELELAQVIAEIDSRKVPDISIIGHTDTAGESEPNERLGLERANMIRSLIQSSKLNADNVSVVSHGEKNLLVPTPDNTAEARNRRVEITVR